MNIRTHQTSPPHNTPHYIILAGKSSLIFQKNPASFHPPTLFTLEKFCRCKIGKIGKIQEDGRYTRLHCGVNFSSVSCHSALADLPQVLYIRIHLVSHFILFRYSLVSSLNFSAAPRNRIHSTANTTSKK